MAYAQTNQSAIAVSAPSYDLVANQQQGDQGGSQDDPGSPVDTAAKTADVGSAPATPVGKTGAPAATAPGTAAVGGYTFPTGSEMKHYWLRNVIGPRAYIGA